MKSLPSLEKVFPGEGELISALRLSYQQFEDDCADYELLVSDLGKLDSTTGSSEEHQAVILEILGELEVEITKSLETFKETGSL